MKKGAPFTRYVLDALALYRLWLPEYKLEINDIYIYSQTKIENKMYHKKKDNKLMEPIDPMNLYQNR
jgi:hypothetical protein